MTGTVNNPAAGAEFGLNRFVPISADGKMMASIISSNISTTFKVGAGTFGGYTVNGFETVVGFPDLFPTGGEMTAEITGRIPGSPNAAVNTAEDFTFNHMGVTNGSASIVLSTIGSTLTMSGSTPSPLTPNSTTFPAAFTTTAGGQTTIGKIRAVMTLVD